MAFADHNCDPSLVPAQDRPTVMGSPALVEHFSIFFATGLAFGVGYPQRRLFQFVALLAFAAAIELAQLLVPGRHARLSDFLIDAWGGNCWSVDWLPRLAQAHANDDPSGFNKTLRHSKSWPPHGTLPLWSCETVVLRHELRRRFLCLT